MMLVSWSGGLVVVWWWLLLPPTRYVAIREDMEAAKKAKMASLAKKK